MKLNNDYLNKFSLSSIQKQKQNQNSLHFPKKVTSKDVKRSLKELNEMLNIPETPKKIEIPPFQKETKEIIIEQKKLIEDAISSLNKQVESLKDNYRECISPENSSKRSSNSSQNRESFIANGKEFDPEFDFEINRIFEVQITNLLSKFNNLKLAFEEEQIERVRSENKFEKLKEIVRGGTTLTGEISEIDYYISFVFDRIYIFDFESLELKLQFSQNQISDVEIESDNVVVTIEDSVINLNSSSGQFFIKNFSNLGRKSETQNASNRNSIQNIEEEIPSMKTKGRFTEDIPKNESFRQKKRAFTANPNQKPALKSLNSMKEDVKELDFDFKKEEVEKVGLANGEKIYSDFKERPRSSEMQRLSQEQPLFESKTLKEYESEERKSKIMKEDEYSQYREVLNGGMSFIKYGKKGFPHSRVVFLSNDGHTLHYGKSKTGKTKGILISDIIDIKEGRETAVFKRHKPKAVFSSFSFITPTRTLDLEAKNPEMKKIFISCIRTLFKAREAQMDSLIRKVRNSNN